MNKNDSKNFKMQGTTDTFLADNLAKIITIPAIVEAKSKLSANLLTIQTLNQQSADSQSTVVTKFKKNIKSQVGQKTEIIAGIVNSYASSNKMDELYETSKFAVSDLTHVRENDLDTKVRPILKSAREMLTDLAASGLTTDMVDEADALLVQYNGLINKPRKVINQQNTTKKMLSKLIRDNNDIFTKELDKLMLQFKDKDPDFYSGYLRARTVIDTATKHRDKNEDPDADK